MEQEIIQIAKVKKNIDGELYRLTGIRPLPSPPNPKVITNDDINELREQYGI